METIAPAAQTLSTFGLYAIVAALVFVVIYLYKRIVDLEKELRTTLSSNASSIATNAAETAKLLEQTTQVLRDNTRALQDFQNTLADLKSTVQIAIERTHK